MQLSDTKINFYGDRIAWDRPSAIAALLYRKDILAFAFSMGVTEVCFPPDSFWQSALIACAANVGLIFMQRLQEKYNYMGPELREAEKSDKCIETKPDNKIPPTLDKWGLSAKSMRYRFAETFFVATVPLALACWQTPAIIPYFTALYPALLTRLIDGFHRWNKVAKGDWVIDDKGPPPEPVKKPPHSFRLIPARLITRRAALALNVPKF